MNAFWKYCLTSLPFFAHFLVAHGTLQRTLIPESAFVLLFGGLLLAPILFRKSRPASASTSDLRKLLLPFIAYFCVLNPAYSLLSGSVPERVLMITSAFVAMALYARMLNSYEFGFVDLTRFLYLFIGLGLIVALQIGLNYLSGGASDSGRSTALELGEETQRTLTLPHIPIALAAAIPLALTHPKRDVRAAFLIATPILFVAMTMTATRAMFLAVMGATTVSLFVLRYVAGVPVLRSLFDVILASGSVITAIVLFADTIVTMITTIAGRAVEGGDTEDVYTVLGRLDEYSAAMDGFSKSPLFGQGIGNLFWFPSDYDLVLRLFGTSVPHSHIFFVLGATGLVGFIVYYGLLGMAARKLFAFIAATRVAVPLEKKVVAVSYLSGFLGGFIFTLSSTTFLVIGYSFFLGAFIYFSANAMRFAVTQPATRAG